jgi:hypothetical protein
MGAGADPKRMKAELKVAIEQAHISAKGKPATSVSDRGGSKRREALSIIVGVQGRSLRRKYGPLDLPRRSRLSQAKGCKIQRERDLKAAANYRLPN